MLTRGSREQLIDRIAGLFGTLQDPHAVGHTNVRVGTVVHVLDDCLDQFVAAVNATPHSDEVTTTTSTVVDGRRYTVTIGVRT